MTRIQCLDAPWTPWLPAACVLLLTVAGPAAAQQPADDLGPLYTQTPFDRVVLKSGETVEVQPLRFAGGARSVPQPLPQSGELSIRPLDADNPTTEYSVPWSAVARIDQFEDMILAEALRLTEEGEFDEAYPYFSYLVRRAPETRNLDQGLARYLQSNARTAFQAGEFDKALAILGSLYERSPQAADLSGAVDTVAERIIQQYLESRNYKSARQTLEVVARNFEGLDLQVVRRWRQRFQQAASRQLDEAERLIEAGNYLEARQAIDQAVGVWPELEGVEQVQARLQREHPVVTVGVLEPAPRNPTHRLDSPPSLRAATLVQPTLTELYEYTAEGGAYRSPVGQINLAPSGLELSIELADGGSEAALTAGLGASALARQLVEATRAESGHFNAPLAGLIEQVGIEYPRMVHVALSRAHVRPESLLDVPLEPELAPLCERGVYTLAEQADGLTRFEVQYKRTGAIAEVHERLFENDDQAVAALSRGSVDVLDRVPPWQVRNLQALEDVTVARYRLPTVHALVPTGRAPLTQQREFRRALCYGIDRKRFVDAVLLAGNEEPGFQVVSGPFPAGVTLSDPIRYGYNSQVEPRVYDPYMAIVLALAAWKSVQNQQGVEEPGSAPLPTLQLGHPADPVARTACVEIAKNLNALEIPVELVELTTEQMAEAGEHVDLKYVELAIWEPVADARTLLGASGLAGDSSDFMLLALDRLDQARNWNEVRSRLHEIHQVASTDLPVIPLWQTVNFFAYRNTLSGIEAQPVRLYQDVGRWNIRFESE